MDQLTTLALVHAEMGLGTDTSLDTKLGPLIIGASGLIRGYCDRTFGYAQNYQEYHVGSVTKRMYLRRRPIWSLTSVQSIHPWCTIQPQSPPPWRMENYVVQGTEELGGYLYRDRGWRMANDSSLDLTQDVLTGDPHWNWIITGTFGYILPGFDGVTDPVNNPQGLSSLTCTQQELQLFLPGDVSYACTRQVAYMATRATALRSEITPGGYKYETWQQNDLIDEIKPFLEYYARKVGFS